MLAFQFVYLLVKDGAMNEFQPEHSLIFRSGIIFAWRGCTNYESSGLVQVPLNKFVVKLFLENSHVGDAYIAVSVSSFETDQLCTRNPSPNSIQMELPSRIRFKIGWPFACVLHRFVDQIRNWCVFSLF